MIAYTLPKMFARLAEGILLDEEAFLRQSNNSLLLRCRHIGEIVINPQQQHKSLKWADPEKIGGGALKCAELLSALTLQ